MNNNDPDIAVLTTSEVAVMLNVHKRTIRKWTNTGVLSSLRVGNRKDRVFTRIDIDRFLRELNAGDIQAHSTHKMWCFSRIKLLNKKGDWIQSPFLCLTDRLLITKIGLFSNSLEKDEAVRTGIINSSGFKLERLFEAARNTPVGWFGILAARSCQYPHQGVFCAGKESQSVHWLRLSLRNARRRI